MDDLPMPRAEGEAVSFVPLEPPAGQPSSRQAATTSDVAVWRVQADGSFLPVQEESGLLHTFPPGTQVSLVGLKRSANLNGMVGRIIRRRVEDGRYEVSTGRGHKIIAPCNLVRVIPVTRPVAGYLAPDAPGQGPEAAPLHCPACGCELTLSVQAVMLLRDDYPGSTVLTHSCGFNCTIFKTSMGPPAEANEKACHLIMHHFDASIYGLDYEQDSLQDRTAAAFAVLEAVENLQLGVGLRDAIKRVGTIQGADVLEAATRLAFRLQGGPPPFLPQVLDRARALIHTRLCQELDWPAPRQLAGLHPHPPAGGGGTGSSRSATDSTGGPDGTAPVLLHCIWCGARMRTAGQAMCPGKWAGIASCGGHRAPQTGSVVMTKAHGVTTIAICTVYEDC
jgi:hypothetical protein